MVGKTLGIFSYPWPEEYVKGLPPQGTPWELQRKVVWRKANPRSEDYMKTLFFNHWPKGDYINADKDPNWFLWVSSADQVVLLYPDAIGLGFRHIESQVFKLKKTLISVHVLNGRRREFILDHPTRWHLYLRRFLERGMFGEALTVLIFLMITPVLLAVDWTKGHR
ncbi:MAG: hypothetical protein ABSH06_01165 [Thermodesulfobacteriota bacterium]|jgi:hypothetical protein